jgi:hypothetical protein
MASQDSSHLFSRSPSRLSYARGRHLVLQDETPPTYSPRSQGTLASLIRTRPQSQSSTHQHHGPVRRATGGLENGPDLEAGAVVDVASHTNLPHGLASPYSITNDDDDAMSTRRSVTEERRLSAILRSHPVRSMRLIGNSNPRYRWEQYWKTEDQLENMRPPVRSYYERTNYLVQQYLYIDRLLDSSLPHDLLNEYNDMPASHFRGVEIPDTIREEHPSGGRSPRDSSTEGAGSGDEATLVNPPHSAATSSSQSVDSKKKVKRTPRDIYRATETTPLFSHDEEDEAIGEEPKPDIPWLDEEDVDSGDRIVTLAIYVNFAANFILLAAKLVVVLSVPSMSVLASLVDAVLDFLSTAIVWLTTWLISRQDQYEYPVGRRRLEPLGVLVFSVIMITSFVQVALQSSQRLMSPDHEVVELGPSAIIIMAGTVVIKGLCWLWCRMVKNSSVQALAADAMTDVIFNTGSILFPISKCQAFFSLPCLNTLGSELTEGCAPVQSASLRGSGGLTR